MRMDMIPSWQFLAMENNLKTIRWIISSQDASTLTQYHDGGSGWSVLQVLCHLRDFEELFFLRARLTVEQDTPALPYPDPDELAAEKRYHEQDVQTVYQQWQTIRAEHIAFLQARQSADWDRPAQHPKRGLMTLIDQLLVTAQHDTTHIEQITRILLEKQ